MMPDRDWGPECRAEVRNIVVDVQPETTKSQRKDPPRRFRGTGTRSPLFSQDLTARRRAIVHSEIRQGPPSPTQSTPAWVFDKDATPRRRSDRQLLRAPDRSARRPRQPNSRTGAGPRRLLGRRTTSAVATTVAWRAPPHSASTRARAPHAIVALLKDRRVEPSPLARLASCEAVLDLLWTFRWLERSPSRLSGASFRREADLRHGTPEISRSKRNRSAKSPASTYSRSAASIHWRSGSRVTPVKSVASCSRRRRLPLGRVKHPVRASSGTWRRPNTDRRSRTHVRRERVAAVDRALVRARRGEVRGRLETARLVGANPPPPWFVRSAAAQICWLSNAARAELRGQRGPRRGSSSRAVGRDARQDVSGQFVGLWRSRHAQSSCASAAWFLVRAISVREPLTVIG